MDFKTWLEQQGCIVTVEQEDDGSGYTVLEVITPGYGQTYRISVDT
jgi:hypothetical protein